MQSQQLLEASSGESGENTSMPAFYTLGMPSSHLVNVPPPLELSYARES